MHGTSLHQNNTAYVVDEVHLHHQHAEARTNISPKALYLKRSVSVSLLSVSLGVSHVTDTQNSQILLPVNTRVVARQMIATVCVGCVCGRCCLMSRAYEVPTWRCGRGLGV
jgi:hypothetical protein